MDHRGAHDDIELTARQPYARPHPSNLHFADHGIYLPPNPTTHATPRAQHGGAGAGAAVSPGPPASNTPAQPQPEDEINVKFLGTHHMFYDTNRRNIPYSCSGPTTSENDESVFSLPHGAPGWYAPTESITALPSIAPGMRDLTANRNLDPYADYWILPPEDVEHGTSSNLASPFLQPYASHSNHGIPRPQRPPPSQPYDPSQFSSMMSPDSARSFKVDENLVAQDKDKSKILGYPKKLVWIIAGCVFASLVVIGAVVGGVLASQRQHKMDNAYVPIPNTTLELKSTSQITAVNWTDPVSRVDRYGVFTQDANDDIFLLYRDSRNDYNWVKLNVSDALATTGNSIHVRPGSALAAVATGPPSYQFELHLYYIANDTNMVEEIKTTDAAMKKWERGAIPSLPDLVDRQTNNSSQLSAAWTRCDKDPVCKDFIYVVYQDTRQTIQLLNSSDWSKTTRLSGVGTSGSGVAMTEIADGTDLPGQLRMFYELGGKLREQKYNTTGDWATSSTVITENSISNPSPQFASASFDSWKKVAILQSENNGDLMGHLWSGTEWTQNNRVQLKLESEGAPTALKLTAITLDRCGHMYGVERTNSTTAPAIYQFGWGVSGGPFNYQYISKVVGSGMT